MLPSACLATDAESRAPLPGDGLIARPGRVVTHGIDIRAGAAGVWPWLVQMGGGRAGWYSWDWIDNGGRPSAAALLPECQDLAVGESIPAMPGSVTAFRVAILEPAADLVLVMEGRDGAPRLAWGFHLRPRAAGGTRLLMRAATAAGAADLSAGTGGRGARFAARYFAVLARGPRPLFDAGARLGRYIMGTKMLNGIRSRAEAPVRAPQ